MLKLENGISRTSYTTLPLQPSYHSLSTDILYSHYQSFSFPQVGFPSMSFSLSTPPLSIHNVFLSIHFFILIDISYPSSSSFILPLWLSRTITEQLFYSLFNSFFIYSTNLIHFSSSICNSCLLVINRLKNIMKSIN